MADQKPVDQKIDYIEFWAANFAAIESFYSETFGWEFTPYGEDYLAFTDGKLDGGFSKTTDPSCVSRAAKGGALLILFADDLEATQEKVVANGGRICVEIFSFPGGRRFQFLDPHGNELGVWSDK